MISEQNKKFLIDSPATPVMPNADIKKNNAKYLGGCYIYFNIYYLSNIIGIFQTKIKNDAVGEKL